VEVKKLNFAAELSNSDNSGTVRTAPLSMGAHRIIVVGAP